MVLVSGTPTSGAPPYVFGLFDSQKANGAVLACRVPETGHGAGNGGQVERVPETGTGRMSRKLGRFWGWSCYQRARRFCRAGERIKFTGEVLKRNSRRRQFTLQFLGSLCSHAARNQRALQEPSLQIYQLDPGDVRAVPGTDAAFQRSAAQRPGSSRPVVAKCFKGFHNPNFPK